MRRSLGAIAAISAVLAFSFSLATPAQAHTAACGSSCNVLTEWHGAYVDFAPFWCYNPSGTTDLSSVNIVDTYGNSNAWWHMKVINYDTGAIKWDAGSVYLGNGDPHFWDLETSGPSAQTNGDWYVWLEFDPDVGFTHIYRIAVEHATTHGSPFVIIDDKSVLSYSQAECS